MLRSTKIIDMNELEKKRIGRRQSYIKITFETKRGGKTDRQTCRQTGRPADRQTDRPADRLTDRQTRQTDRQMGRRAALSFPDGTADKC